MKKKITLNLEINVKSDMIAKNVVKSLSIDINGMSDLFERSSLVIKEYNSFICLQIQAQDLISAKASINTCLKWLENSLKIQEKFM